MTLQNQYASGQALVITAVFLLIITSIGTASLAVIEFRSDDAKLVAITRTADIAGANSLDLGSLVSSAPIYGGLAKTRTLQALKESLATSFPTSSLSRINIDGSIEASTVTIINASLSNPIRGPDESTYYHYPTVCLRTKVLIGLVSFNHLVFFHAHVACAQLAP